MLDESENSSDRVALLLAQGAASTSAILGTLKSGKAYVSLEPADPRGAQIVDSLNAAVARTDAEHRDAARALAGA